MYKKLRLVFPLSLFLCSGILIQIPSSLAAGPSIASVSGTASDGQTLTITGSSFGGTGPSVQVFDDFEKGSNGTSVTLSSPKVGTYSSVTDGSGTAPLYTTDYHVSGTKAMKVDFGSGMKQVKKIFSGTTDVFFSFWQFLPSGKNVPGQNQGLPNWKFWWIGGDGWPMASDYVDVSLDNTFASTVWQAGDDRNSPTRYGYSPSWLGTNETKGAWIRRTVYMKNSTSAGIVWDQELTSANGVNVRLNATGVVTAHSGEPWTTFYMPGYGRTDSNTVIYWDDLYLASGSGAQARIEIGNKSTYSSCTNLALFTPTAWNDTSITATVRTGSFASGNTAYLFVVNANGVMNSTGYPLTIGATASGDTNIPSTPDNLHVQ